MKKLPLIIFVIMISFSLAHADFCVKIEEHRDSHYHHGSLEPAEDSEIEVWFGDGRAAVLENSRRYIIDINTEKVFIVDMDDSVYVETGLPLELAAVVPEQQVPRLAMFPTVGEVENLEETREVLGRECRGHLVKTWVNYQGSRYNERESRVWTCSDMPVERELLEAYNRSMISLRNMKDEMREKMLDMEGLILLSETVEFSEGFEVNSSARVTECGEMEPGKAVYSIPEGFSRQERLSPRRR